jgi:NitT/TauT family transport system ATP-binding protein
MSTQTRGIPPVKLSVRDLSVTYANPRIRRPLDVLDGIGFEILEREFVSIVGPSGCGKTTLLHCLAGLHPTSSGLILCDGAPVGGAHLKCAMVFQSPTLLPWRNVRDNVAYGLALRGRRDADAEARVAALVKLVGLSDFERHYPHELSGGMQQRVNLARALAVGPEVLLMDEPFAALDAQTREDMQAELLRIWEHDRRTVVFVTHQIEEAVYLSDRVLVLGRRPAKVQAAITIGLSRPRATRVKRSVEFNEYVDQIATLVMRDADASGAKNREDRG